MMQPSPESQAMRQFIERTRVFVEAAALDFNAEAANQERHTDFWADVIGHEARYLNEHGPGAYLHYIAQFEDPVNNLERMPR